MNKRLEKAIDAIDDQAHRFDKLEKVVETTAEQIEVISKKQDRLLNIMESIVEEQRGVCEAIDRDDEKIVAMTELFLRLSNRVDVIEEVVTPLPGNGNGSGYM